MEGNCLPEIPSVLLGNFGCVNGLTRSNLDTLAAENGEDILRPTQNALPVIFLLVLGFLLFLVQISFMFSDSSLYFVLSFGPRFRLLLCFVEECVPVAF